MRRFTLVHAVVGALTLTAASANPAPAQQAEVGPRVGDVAPDFSLTGATRYGILRDQIKLSSYRGNTVVLAFFIKARTRG